MSTLDRILRQADTPGLLEALTERLSPTDLQSLLLEVYRRRAAAVTPGRLLESYQRNRFTAPSALAGAAELARVEALIHRRLPAHGFEALALSPLCPLGTVTAVAAVVRTAHQDRVLSTVRNTEVVSDTTNVLALECAVRRRAALRADPRARSRERVRLAATQRVVRAQDFGGRGASHFALLGLCTAGRDEGAFRFETAALAEHLGVHLDLLARLRDLGYPPGAVEVTVTDLTGGPRRAALRREVLQRLGAAHPGVAFGFDDDRRHGRGYYADACFEIHATGAGGERVTVVDGGFTRWTAGLLSNAKERLLISGLGVERLMSALRRLPQRGGPDAVDHA